MHASAAPSDDELFRPTIRNVPPPVRAPFAVSSLLYVGALGGPFASTGVALLNSARLGVDARVRLGVLLTGALGVALMLLAAAVGTQAVGQLAVALPGAATAFLQARLLGPQERYWRGRGVQPASLLRVGLAAVLAGLYLAFAAIGLVEPR